MRVHLRADADEAATADLHEAVISTSPVGHTLQRPAALRVELVAAQRPGARRGGIVLATTRRALQPRHR